MIPLLSNALFVDLLDAAQTSFRAAGYQTLMGVTHYNPSEEEQLLREQLLPRVIHHYQQTYMPQPPAGPATANRYPDSRES